MAGLHQLAESQIVNAISQIHEFDTFGIAYIGGYECRVLREPELPEGYRTWIILKEEDYEEESAEIVVKATVAKSSTVGKEAIDVFINCGTTVLAGVVATAGAGAAPLTAGTSTVVAYLGYTAAAAGALQCGISSGRLFNAIFAPESNEILDSMEWMRTTSTTLDAIALAGGIAGLGQTAKAALRLSRSSGRPLVQVMQKMTRAERKLLAQEIAKYSHQASTRRQFIRLARAGKVPKIFTQKQISLAVRNQLLDTLGNIIGNTYTGSKKVIEIYFTEDE